MKRLKPFTLIALTSILSFSSPVLAWNVPGHILSGAIAYQTLRRESPATVIVLRGMLEKHPRYESHWKGQLDKLPENERDEMLFMLAAP